MALWRYALGLLCLMQTVPVTAQSDPPRIAFGDDLKMRHQLSSLHTLHLLHPLAAVRSVGANSTAPGTPGSVCAAEGEWNCLTTCWQRCASGEWSDTMALVPGTVCMPAGLSYEMEVVGSRRSTSDSTSESTAGALATILAATTGLCQCTVADCSATPPSSSVAATTSPTTTMASNQETATGGEFVSGSSSAATQQPTSAVAVVLGVSLLAVVFARLLM